LTFCGRSYCLLHGHAVHDGICLPNNTVLSHGAWIFCNTSIMTSNLLFFKVCLGKPAGKGNVEISSSITKVSVFDSKQEKETVMFDIVSYWLWIHPSFTSNGMTRLFAR
jgi:hypothetical protein